MTTKNEKGKWGEQAGAEYLQKLGYRIIDKNFRTSYGEIDLIALETIKDALGNDEDTLVFIEVKMRTSKQFGNPEDSIDRRKLNHLLASIQLYLQGHPEIDIDWRIDVIAIERYQNSVIPKIHHFINAITNVEMNTIENK